MTIRLVLAFAGVFMAGVTVGVLLIGLAVAAKGNTAT